MNNYQYYNQTTLQNPSRIWFFRRFQFNLLTQSNLLTYEIKCLKIKIKFVRFKSSRKILSPEETLLRCVAPLKRKKKYRKNYSHTTQILFTSSTTHSYSYCRWCLKTFTICISNDLELALWAKKLQNCKTKNENKN